MKIIDAHLHFFAPNGHFNEIAAKAGHEASVAHVEEMFAANGIVCGIGMGTTEHAAPGGPLTLPFAAEKWPADFRQCLGIAAESLTPENRREVLREFARELEEERTVGIKVYAGYRHFYVNDPLYHPFYELAEHCGAPVVIHTGDTANSRALLKYSHPLTVDEAAVNFPRVKFVMAHYGNPWIVDATEVAKKNPNVFIDLSGLAEGCFAPEEFCRTYGGYLTMVQNWLTYLSRYDKVMYGSDWPLVNVPAYIELIARLIPEEHHAAVFYENAKRLFKITGK